MHYMYPNMWYIEVISDNYADQVPVATGDVLSQCHRKTGLRQ